MEGRKTKKNNGRNARPRIHLAVALGIIYVTLGFAGAQADTPPSESTTTFEGTSITQCFEYNYHCLDAGYVQSPRDPQHSNAPYWSLDYFRPTHFTGLLPAIVILHGGGWILGDKSSYYTDKPYPAKRWASLGCFVMTINYRLASDKDTRRPTWPQVMEDCKCAVRWLRGHAAAFKVDPNRIAAYGSSAGGHLALMLGILSKSAGYNYEGDGPYQDQSSDVCAVISDSGVVNLNYKLPGNFALSTGINYFLGSESPAPAVMDQASPAHYAKDAKRLPPFLMLYNTADQMVPIKWVDKYITDLRAHGMRDLTYIPYDFKDNPHPERGPNHCPYFGQEAPGSAAEVERFIRRVLKPAAPRPAPTPTPK